MTIPTVSQALLATGRFLALRFLVTTETIHRRCKPLSCPLFMTTPAFVVHDPFEAELVVSADMTSGARFHDNVPDLVQVMTNGTIVVDALEMFAMIENHRSHVFLFVIEHNHLGQRSRFLDVSFIYLAQV